MRESGIKISGTHVTFEKPVNVYMLKKINGAIEEIKSRPYIENDKIEVSLSFSELQLIRRQLIEDDIRIRLMYHSVVESAEYRKLKVDK